MNRPDPAHDDAHTLMPDWLAAEIPALYATERVVDPTVHCKMFTPDSSYTWFVTEYSAVAPDGAPRLCFGLVDWHELVVDYFRVDGFERATGLMQLYVDR